MSTNIFSDQAEFMRAMGQDTTKFNKTQANMYLRLIKEEFCEVLCAATNDIDKKHWLVALFDNLDKYCKLDPEGYDPVEVFDGLLDVIVVAAGAGISMNLPMQAGWDEVVSSNNTKIDPVTGKVLRREDGKVLKGPNYSPPSLQEVMRYYRNS